MVDNSGNYLQAFPVTPDGTSSSISVTTSQAIQITETAGSPVSTSEIGLTMNLAATATPLDPENFESGDQYAHGRANF